MLLDIVLAGDPVLRRPASPVKPEEIGSPFFQELISSMVQTMRAAPGVGLAATQVGESLRLFVMEDGGEVLDAMSETRLAELGRRPLPLTVLVNPELEVIGDQTATYFEGCLSVPGWSALVERHSTLIVRGLDEKGSPVEMELTGWPARIVQHEADHLLGTLYTDRMVPRSFTTVSNLGRYWKARPAADVSRDR